MTSILLASTLIPIFATYTFTVQEASTNKAIPYVQVVCLQHREGGVSNRHGIVMIKLNAGEHDLHFRHIGYVPYRLKFFADHHADSIVIKLQPRVLQVEGVEIIGRYTPEFYGVKVLDPETIARNISVGEPDVLRSLQQLPSMSAANDYASLPGIRGLPASYTHVYLEGAPVLNPYHVGGLFSAFDAGMVGEIETYPGIAPVKFGDYGGGLVSLRPKFTREKETSVELGVLSISYRMLRSPRPDWQSSLSMRFFTLAAVAPVLGGERFDYYFADAQWASRLSLKRVINVETNVYGSYESLPNAGIDYGILQEQIQTKPRWNNLIFNLSFRWGPASLSLYHSSAPMEMQTNRNWVHNKIMLHGARFLYPWQIYRGKLETGFAYEHSRFDYQWHFDKSNLDDIVGIPQNIFFDDAPPIYAERFRFRSLAPFAEYTGFLGPTLSLVFGLRLQEFNRKVYPEPRTQLRWQYKTWQLGLGYGLVHKLSYTLREKYNQEIFTPFSIRFPAFDRPLAIHTFLLSAQPRANALLFEFYFRRFYHIPVYDWSTLAYYRSHGFATGMEISYNGTFLKGTWEISYVLATSRAAWRQRWQPTAQDRRHQLKVKADYLSWKKWRMGLQFQLASGYPYSSVTHWRQEASREFNITPQPIIFYPRFGEPFNQRYPTYQRLDVLFEKDWRLWGGSLTTRLSIINLYYKNNPFYYDVYYENFQPKIEKLPNFPILPSFHLAYKF